MAADASQPADATTVARPSLRNGLDGIFWIMKLPARAAMKRWNGDQSVNAARERAQDVC
jgi:hypothetical protein